MSRADRAPFRGCPLNWYGGKWKVAHKIVPHLARRPRYIEPFFGGGGVFFAVPAGAYLYELVNDLDHLGVTFFRVLRDRPDDLVRAIKLTPYSLEEFEACFAAPVVEGDDVETARRCWVVSRQGFLGRTQVSGWTREATRVRSTEARIQELHAFARRLHAVQFDCVDALDVIGRATRPECALYLDPPYVHDTRVTRAMYVHEMGEDAHRALGAAARRAAEAGAAVLVSGYDSPLYAELYEGWRKIEFDVFVALTGARRTEVLWASYPVEEEWGDRIFDLREGKGTARAASTATRVLARARQRAT